MSKRAGDFIEVKDLISSGDNRLGVILADGWFRNFRPNSGKLITDYATPADLLKYDKSLKIMKSSNVK